MPGEATGKLGFPGNLLSVSLHHAMTAPKRSCRRVVAAAPPEEDPSSTQVCGPPARLSPDPVSSSALAHSGWSLTHLRAVAAPVRPTPSQQGTHHPQRACPCVSTLALLMPWLPGCVHPCSAGRSRLISMCPAWAQRGEGDNPGRGREVALDSRGRPAVLAWGHGKRAWQKQAAPARGKRREGGESKAWQGLAGLQILTSCHWKRGEGNQDDGGKVLSEATLHSQDPDPPPHHPRAGLGFASPFWALLLAPPGTSQLLGMWSPQQPKPCCKQKDGFRREGRTGSPRVRCEMH